MKPYRYIFLSEAEAKEVDFSYKSGDKHHFRERCHALMLNHDGRNIVEIASLLKKRRETIHRWFDNWEARGLSGLSIRPGRGAKPALKLSDAAAVDFVKKK